MYAIYQYIIRYIKNISIHHPKFRSDRSLQDQSWIAAYIPQMKDISIKKQKYVGEV